MTTKTTFLLALGLLGCCGTMTARAEPLGPGQAQIDRGLPAFDVSAIVRSMDLDPIVAPVRRGSRYVVHAVDHYGQVFRVVIDAQVGRILRVLPVMNRARMAEYGPPRGFERPPAFVPPPRGWRESDSGWDDDVAPGWRDAPPPRADVPRPNLAPQARLSPDDRTGRSGPSVIYADPRMYEPAGPSQSSRMHEQHPIIAVKPPLPRPRPAEASVGEQAALPHAAPVMPEVKPATAPAKPEASIAPEAKPEVLPAPPLLKPQVAVAPPSRPEPLVAKPQSPVEPQVKAELRADAQKAKMELPANAQQAKAEPPVPPAQDASTVSRPTTDIDLPPVQPPF